MVDQQPRLEVLAVVGEIQAEQLGVAAGRVEAHRGRHSRHFAAERDRDMTQDRVLAQPSVVRADVHGIVGPVGDPHHREPGGVADDDFHVVGIGSTATMVDDDDRFGELLDPHLQVSVGHRAFAGSLDRDLHRLGGLRVTRNGDDGRHIERRKSLRSNAVRRDATLPESLVAATYCLHPHVGPFTDRDGRTSRWPALILSCRPRNRRNGVNRQISSRPPGTSNALTSNEENTSPLVNPVSEEPSTAVFWAVIRRSLPSAARSAG